MSSFVITTDLTADVPSGLISQGTVPVLPMPYSIDGVEYSEKNQLTFKAFYDKLRDGGITTTSQVDLKRAEEIFTEILKQDKDILHISFSSGMSGSYDNLSVLAKRLMEKFPKRKIHVVDTLSGAGGEGLIVYYAYKKYQEGKSLEDIARYIENIKMSVSHYFIIRDLKFLLRGGRISKADALIGSVLDIKPILSLSKQGKIVPVRKSIGKKRVMIDMIKILIKNYDKSINDFVLIGHGDCIEDAMELKDKILDVMPDVRIEFTPVSYLVGAHAGANSLALFFVGGSRK